MNAQLRILDLPLHRLAPSPSLAPFLKWPGGKSQELSAIAAAAPPLTGRFIDPFVGGGSVLLAVPEEVDAWVNDAAEDLIELYRAAAEERRGFRDATEGVAQAWDALRSFEESTGPLLTRSSADRPGSVPRLPSVATGRLV